MFTGELKVGDRLIWRHMNPHAFAEVEVELIHSCFRERIVRITDGRDWHSEMPESILQHHCMRDQRHGFWFFCPSPERWQEHWHAQAKTAAQQSQAAAENPNREPTGQDASIIHPL